MRSSRRTAQLRFLATSIAALAALLGLALLPHSSSAAPSLGQLNDQLQQQQAHQQNLSGSISALSATISSLDSEIALVQSREAAVRADLANDRAQLARIQSSLAHERRVVTVLRGELNRARTLLAGQLISSYESDHPDLVSVVLQANGFTDLLERIDFLRRTEQAQTAVVQVTKEDKARADAAEKRLVSLESTEQQITDATAARARALAGMNALLGAKQAAVARARAAQQAALAASRARGAQLQAAISQLQAQQAAAQAAATSAAGASGSYASGPALGPSGGWAIPYAIVLCESGGQNLPPNSAGASGYYQILPSTWTLYGGSGPAAYLAPKSEQDAVAARIWAGSGPSAWVCAGIVGIH